MNVWRNGSLMNRWRNGGLMNLQDRWADLSRPQLSPLQQQLYGRVASRATRNGEPELTPPPEPDRTLNDPQREILPDKED